MDLFSFLGKDYDKLNEATNKFIDVSNYNPSDEDLKKIKVYDSSLNAISKTYKIRKIDNKIFYFKSINSIYLLINELIGEDIAKLLSLPTVEYQLAKYNYCDILFHGLISENFKVNDQQIIDNKSNIKPKSFDNYDEFMYDIYKMCLLDFYTSQIDRVDSNYNVIKDNKNIKLGKLFDYSASFNVLSKSNIYPYFYDSAYVYSHFYESNLNTMNEKYIYSNSMLKLVFPSKELNCILKKYSKLNNELDKLYNYDLIESINAILKYLNINISDELLIHYESQQKSKQKIIERI